MKSPHCKAASSSIVLGASGDPLVTCSFVADDAVRMIEGNIAEYYSVLDWDRVAVASAVAVTEKIAAADDDDDDDIHHRHHA